LSSSAREAGVQVLAESAFKFVRPHGRKADVEMPCISGRVVTVIL
jgi:hypothetical protein